MEAVVSAVLEQLKAIIRERRFGSVVQDFYRLEDKFQAIRAVLEDAEQRQMKEELVRVWMDEVKYVSYDMEDMLDEWNTAPRLPLKMVCSFLPASCFGFNRQIYRRHHVIASEIKSIAEHLVDIARKMDMFSLDKNRSLGRPIQMSSPTISLVDETHIYGRDDEKYTIISKLLSESSENKKGLHVISIVGMGGIGKTSLAQIVFNDDRVRSHFDALIWVCVSDPFDEFRIAKSIIEALLFSVPDLVEFQSLLQYISKSIVGKKFFLVLDDVWTDDYTKWEPFRRSLMNGLHGSKILITTRKETVAHMMESTNIIAVRGLSEEAAWLLFRKIAFSGKLPKECEELEDIGRKIVHKCGGLPLAMKAIASVLTFRNIREWEAILNSEIWELKAIEGSLFASMSLSYNDLPSNAKRCFLYCAIFPENFQIEKDKLIKLWMAQGYLEMGVGKDMEKIGQHYFDLLVTRSFFLGFEKDDNGDILRYKMHKIVLEFAQRLTMNEIFCREVDDGLQETDIAFDYKLRHIMLALNKGVSFPRSLLTAKKVRSLLIQYGVTNCLSVSEILPVLFRELTSLRALDLSGQLWWENVIIKIPREIKELILLRYLNLSLLKIKELPEELCELFNLQTLDLSWCTDLRELPQGMGNLIKLRHLVNVETSLSFMPRGIESLTSLRTLSEFFVSGGGGGDSKACTLACLKNLNHLEGSLHIKFLGNVTVFNEVVEAELHNKIGVTHLYLNFENEAEEVSMDKDEESRMFTDESFVSAGGDEVCRMLLPPNLAFLEIRGYKGSTRFLNCIMSLNELKTLNLHSCTNLDHLPPLGKLPSLELLSISSVRSVRVGNELLGIRCDVASSSSPDIAFAKLKSLKFVNMEEWKDWDCGTKDCDCGKIMPCLHFLSLVHCPKLKALPDQILRTETLEELAINWCPILEERYNNKTGEWRYISHIPNIMIGFEYVQRGRP